MGEETDMIRGDLPVPAFTIPTFIRRSLDIHKTIIVREVMPDRILSIGETHKTPR